MEQWFKNRASAVKDLFVKNPLDTGTVIVIAFFVGWLLG